MRAMSGDSSLSSARRRLASREARGAEGWRQQHEQRLAALEAASAEQQQSAAALLDLVEATMPIEEALAELSGNQSNRFLGVLI